MLLSIACCNLNTFCIEWAGNNKVPKGIKKISGSFHVFGCEFFFFLVCERMVKARKALIYY